MQLVPENRALDRQVGPAEKDALDYTPPGQRLLDTGPSTVAEAGSCASSEVHPSHAICDLIWLQCQLMM
jgi:hypothetical protein